MSKNLPSQLRDLAKETTDLKPHGRKAAARAEQFKLRRRAANYLAEAVEAGLLQDVPAEVTLRLAMTRKPVRQLTMVERCDWHCLS